MSSFRRIGATVAVAGAAVALLSGCDKPVPLVTVLANNTVTRISPQAYCFDPNPAHCRKSTSNPQSISARAGGTISIDVPKSVADKAWLVSAYYYDANNKLTPIANAGTTLLHDTNNARVTVPFGVGSGYFISVQQTDGKTAAGIWQASVNITGSEG